MLERPAIIDELLKTLSAWVASLSFSRPLGAYLFGSTVNEGGVRFQPHSGDLDVILVVDWEGALPGERIPLINALREAKHRLETDLLVKLRRENAAEQIVSLVPITKFEFEHAIHKDGVKHILTKARAFDLLKMEEVDNLGGGKGTPALEEIHRTVLSFVQKKRAEAVSVTPNGQGGLTIKAHQGDPVPKELMRNFAIATANVEADADVSDLARGLREITKFSYESVGWTPLTSSFSEWLETKRGARGVTIPVISHDHYLLLVETIYDRVREQYPTSVGVRFTGSGGQPKKATKSPTSQTSSKCLTAKFRVTLSDKLGGSKEEVLRAIRSARANMKARVAEPFELLFDEEAGAAELLATEDTRLDTNAHRKKVKAFELRTRIEARQSRWSEGVRLILYYGGTLFQCDEDKVEKACRIAISNWFTVAATNAVNPGGIFEAFHSEFYPSHGLAFSFPANVSTLKILGTQRPLASLKADDLASGFVPNLISKYLHVISQQKHEDLRDSEDRVFNVSFWDYGVK